MKINFYKDKKIKTVDLLCKHDLVFRGAVCDPSHGLPVGNGRLGGLIWIENEGIKVQINHTDLVDDFGKDKKYCVAGNEGNTICRNGALFSINFNCPIFESIYIKNYCSRLSLKDATASIESQTPFGNVNVNAFCSEKHDVLSISVKTEFSESLPIRCNLKRWGSRSFMYWYAGFVDNPYGTDEFYMIARGKISF